MVSGHSLLTGLYVLLGRGCQGHPRLYRRRSVCQAENVPFQSKIELVVQEIGQFEPVEGTQTHVLMDSRFHCKAVRKAAQERGREIGGGLKSNRKMRLISPDGTRRRMTPAEYAPHLQAADRLQATWPSQESGERVYVHAIRTHIRKLGPVLLLITCKDLKAPTNPSATGVPLCRTQMPKRSSTPWLSAGVSKSSSKMPNTCRVQITIKL